MYMIQPSSNQISFSKLFKGGDAAITSGKTAGDFIYGFFDGKIFSQHQELKKGLDDSSIKNIIFELPPFAGKTTGAFFAAFLTAFEQGRNVMMIYPSEEKRDIAFKYLERELERIQYSQYALLEVIDDKKLVSQDKFNTPLIYLTDVFSLHTNILPRYKLFSFWHLMGLVVLEDMDHYNYTFGANCAYLFRRLFAKLLTNSASYKRIFTCNPVNNRAGYIETLTGIPGEDFKIINTNGSEKKSFEIMHWYPPVTTVNYQTEGFVLQKEGFFKELENLIGMLMNSERKSIALLWGKTSVTEDDLANINGKFGAKVKVGQLFLGNSFDMIRRQLLEQNKDWDEIDCFLIVGYGMPIRQYMQELIHMGIPDKRDGKSNLIIIFDIKSPGLQWEIYGLLEKDKIDIQLSSRNLDVNSLKKSFRSESLISNHVSYFVEENPGVDFDDAKAFFPEDYQTHFKEKQISRKTSRFIFLNHDIRHLPKSKRERSQLESGENLFALLMDQQVIGTLAENRIRAYCYPRAKLFYKAKKYTVASVDYRDRNVVLQTSVSDYDFVFRLANYTITVKDEAVQNNKGFFENNIMVAPLNCHIREIFLGRRNICVFNPLDSGEELIEVSEGIGFPETNISAVRIDFSGVMKLLKIHTEKQSLKILHTIAHLLYEACRTELSFKPQEIQIAIHKTTQKEEDEKLENDENLPYTLVYFLDITGENNDFRERIGGMGLGDLFRKAYDMLTKCPCHDGSGACIQVEYCNILHGREQEMLDKIGAMQLIGNLLRMKDRTIDVKQNENWKNGTGILTQHNNKINHMSALVKKVMVLKGGLQISDSDWYAEDFMDQMTIEMTGGNAPGYTDLDNRVIRYLPGLIEPRLYEVLFHERFHNYQFVRENLARSLLFFNWDNIDDPLNIPFGGMLIVEGSATWFAMRMMEFFDMINYMENIENSHILHYRAGLQVMLKMEKEVGFQGALQKLRTGFDTKKYEADYRGEILNARNLYVGNGGAENTGDQQQVVKRLACLRSNELNNEDHLLNFQRLSFLQYYLVKGDIILEKAITELRQNSCAHVPLGQLRYLARMRAEETIAFLNELEANVVPEADRPLRKMGILGIIDGDDRVLCSGCDSKCPLLVACMMCGGRKWFEQFVLAIYPPLPQPVQPHRRGVVRRVFSFFWNLFRSTIRAFINLFRRG
ncbi:MAG: hypothetical protein JW925_14375 [Syntrophaceae bacterium]|nr:hypothetical protein [Syntrophaceae bacterium]